MDIRVTDWFQYPHYGYAQYRIWKRVADGAWHQRHEWVRADGSHEMERWIGTSPQFLDGMKAATVSEATSGYRQ